MTTKPLRKTRPSLNDYPEEWVSMPFFDLTFEMFDCVSKHNFQRLAQICDDDFGIIDINPEGGSEVIRDRAGWEAWFTQLFSRLEEMKAETWSEITRYEALMKGDLGYGVVDFDQILIVGDQRMRFKVLATIIWKKENEAWLESRYHSSMLGMEVE
jgi:hypothetical protein